jgi:hypothetical protein
MAQSPCSDRDCPIRKFSMDHSPNCYGGIVHDITHLSWKVATLLYSKVSRGSVKRFPQA